MYYTNVAAYEGHFTGLKSNKAIGIPSAYIYVVLECTIHYQPIPSSLSETHGALQLSPSPVVDCLIKNT